jgi:hypothetical protein
MNHFLDLYKYLVTAIGILSMCTICSAESIQCSICLQPLALEYSLDAWENAFHSTHEKEGLFCHSCSRIISQSVTQGGYVYSDGRHMCSLCHITAINNDTLIYSAYQSVLEQLKAVGIINIPKKIPITLVDLHILNEKAEHLSHAKLKGFTQFSGKPHLKLQIDGPYHIYILSGLPQLEFEAVLAHEFLHIWLEINSLDLDIITAEGFCNLGSSLIYENDGTQFSQIHLKAMENNADEAYGKSFIIFQKEMDENGWEALILKIKSL